MSVTTRAKPRRVAFRLTAPRPDEDQIHEATAKLLSMALFATTPWTCFPAGNVPLPPEYAAKLARFGLARGWPDILLAHGGIYGIELKRDGAKLSKTRMVRTRRGTLRELAGQADVFPKLLAAGFRDIAVCHSTDEVLAALVRWNIPTRIRSVAA